MKKLKTILVTGCGGDIGQSIGKILKIEYKDINLIGCDIHDKHAGHFIFDKCYEIPKVKSKNYIQEIEKIIDKYKPYIIIPTSEAELRFFYKNKINKILGVNFIIPNFESMKIGDNKLLTQNFLKKNNFPHAWTVNITNGKPKEFPCVLKDVSGRGSKHIKIIHEKEYNKYKNYGNRFILQEYLFPNSEEYTCGLFRSKTGAVRSIIFHRVLTNGYTGYGEIVTNNTISKLLNSIAEKLQLVGSINIQLILTNKKGPVVFEINPRFSSTVLFRHLLGFKDVIWSINDSLDENLGGYDPVQSGIKIYKGWQEFILYNDGRKSTIDNIDFKIRYL